MSFLSNIKRDIDYVRRLKALETELKDLSPEAPITIAGEMERWMDASRTREAITSGGGSWSYATLEERANRFASWGLSQGFKQGDRVALFRENHPDFIATWFGLSKIGVITALINFQLRGESLAHCCNTADVKGIITTQKLAPLVEECRGLVEGDPEVWVHAADGEEATAFDSAVNEASMKRPDTELRRGIASKKTALFIYTSGTTGLPKAARMTHGRALQMLRTFRLVAQMTPDDRLFMPLPLYHATGGICGVGAALSAGATLVLQRSFSVSSFWQDAKASGATSLVYVGELGRYLVNREPGSDERDHSIVKAFGNGMRPEVWDLFSQRTGIGKVYEFYGSTEGNISLFNLDGRQGSVGRVPPLLKPLMPIRLVRIDPDTEEILRTSDGLCQETAIGEAGEAVGKIILKDTLRRFEGYNDERQTERKILRNVFKEGDAYFRSGDLMCRDKDGYFYFKDRLGDTYRWKSENVSTTEVGEVLSRFQAIKTANVYGVTVPGYDGRAGMASLTVAGDFDIAAFTEHITTNLPAYARPVFLRLRQDDDMTGTLKFRKSKLQKEGFDPGFVSEPLFVTAGGPARYLELTSELYNDVVRGTLRI